jgi:hypothetical protein
MIGRWQPTQFNSVLCEPVVTLCHKAFLKFFQRAPYIHEHPSWKLCLLLGVRPCLVIGSRCKNRLLIYICLCSWWCWPHVSRWGKVHRWGTFPKSKATLDNHLILGPFLWKWPPPWHFTLHKTNFRIHFLHPSKKPKSWVTRKFVSTWIHTPIKLTMSEFLPQCL